jgi:hypothetical protein
MGAAMTIAVSATIANFFIVIPLSVSLAILPAAHERSMNLFPLVLWLAGFGAHLALLRPARFST